jgi:hypothetical protein
MDPSAIGGDQIKIWLSGDRHEEVNLQVNLNNNMYRCLGS